MTRDCTKTFLTLKGTCAKKVGNQYAKSRCYQFIPHEAASERPWWLQEGSRLIFYPQEKLVYVQNHWQNCPCAIILHDQIMCEFCFPGGFPIQGRPSQSNIFHRWGSFLPPLLLLQIKWVGRREGAASRAVSGSAMNYSEWMNWVPGGQETGLTLGPVAQWRHLPNQHSSGSPCFIMNSTVIPKEGNQGHSCPYVSMS